MIVQRKIVLPKNDDPKNNYSVEDDSQDGRKYRGQLDKLTGHGKNPKLRVSSYFHSTFSPVSSPCERLEPCGANFLTWGALINTYLT